MNKYGPHLTDKQYKILVVICHGDGKTDDGTFTPVDMDQLLERIAYRTTKQSMQFSIRALIAHGLVTKGAEKRRGSRRVTFIPTKLANQLMGYAEPSFIESTDTPDMPELSL